MPPILLTLGCTKSTAPAAIILRKSEELVAFSPIAIGTPVALRSFAADLKSSGGQIGSSTQCGFDAFMAATGASASPGSQAQLVSTLIGMFGPGHRARRRDRLRRALVQLDVLVAALQRARGVALHVLDVAGVLDQRRVGLDPLALGAAQQLRHRDAFELAADVPQRDVEAADAHA